MAQTPTPTPTHAHTSARSPAPPSRVSRSPASRWLTLVILAVLACVGAVALTVPGVAQATERAPAEGRVVRVAVAGTRFVEEAAVLQNVGLRAGQQLTPEAVRRDLVRVFDTGFFDDVVVRVVPEGDGVLVIFEVVEKPAVLDVRLDGNKKIDEEDLRELIDVKSFGVLSEAKIAETVRALRAKYVEKGFYLATIEPEVVPVRDGAVEVVFHIVENRKVIVQKVDLTGNDNVADRKVKRFLAVKEGGFAPWLTQSGTFDREALEADRQTIQAVFLEEGYIDVKVDAPRVFLSPDKRFIYVTWNVEEGKRFDIGEVTVVGEFVPEEGLTEDLALQIADGRLVADIQDEQWRASRGQKVSRRLGARRGARLVPGEAFKLSTMQYVAGNIGRLWQDQGYAFTNVIPDTRPRRAAPGSDEPNLVDVQFVVEKGERMRIGRIDITGNDPTFDKVVRREIVLSEGQLYSQSLIDASKARLQRLGFFEDVAFSTPRGEEPDVLDLKVKVTEQPTGSFSVGLGYSNLERLAVNAQIQKNNFLGLGWTVNASVNWSALRRQASLQFFDPYFLDSRWTLSIDGYWVERRFIFDEYQRGMTLGIGRYLDRKDDIQLRFDYRIEDVGITSLEAFRQRLLGGQLFRNGLTSSVSLNLVVDKRLPRIFPIKGFYATASVTLAGGFRAGEDKVVSLLGGDFNFVETKLNLRWYQPLIPKSDMLVFRLNSTFGAIFSTDGRVVPFIHRYRAGGINSVRGFQWFSLGPTVRTVRSDDPTQGDETLVLGGSQLWINNFELESPIVRAAGISAVVFFDAGNAFGDPLGGGAINPLKLRTAVGFGVRWRSPIGPLRFEWGFPLKPREDERRNVFDFSIGSFF